MDRILVDSYYPTNVYEWYATPILAARQSQDTNIGSARNQQSSASSVLNTLWPVALYALGFLVLFLIFRVWFPRIYSPRSFIKTIREQERAPTLSKGWVGWLQEYWRTSDTVVLNTYSFDGFLFLRHLKIGVIICLVCCVITWPILIPVNVTGYGNATQLNKLTFSNVASTQHPASYYRFYAHAFCAYLIFGFILYMITRESIYYINLRQAYLVSPLYSDRISSRMVLYKSVPDEYLSEAAMRNLLGEKVVKNVWIPRKLDGLDDKVSDRDKMAMQLEKAEIKLIKMANAARLQAIKEGTAAEVQEKNLKANRVSSSMASRWIEDGKRPTHRLKFLVGKKVDTIDYCREKVAELGDEIKTMQEDQKAGKGEPLNSVFVEFISLEEAQLAYQSLTHHLPLHMAPRYTGVSPQEVIWMNMKIKWWEHTIRLVVTYSAIIALIIFWSFPVAFIGTISQITYLTHTKAFHWLSFIYGLPKQLEGLITGLLPSVMLSVLMSLLPIFLRLMAQLAGKPTKSAVDYNVQNTYFAFYVIQVFLVTTLSSGAAQAAVGIIKNPTSIINLLATSIPEGSDFYLSYMILQGLGVVSQTLLSLTGLVLFIVLGKLLDSSPRSKFSRWTGLTDPGLGTLYPIYTCMMVIAISYSCIAPLVSGFAMAGLFLFYLAYRYNFLFVYDIPFDSKGLMYARSLQQLFVGLYLAQLCLIGLLAIAVGGGHGALGPLILMIIFLIFTIIYHLSLNTALSPLLKYLPKSLEREEERLLAKEDSDDNFVDASEGAAGEGTSRGEKQQLIIDDHTKAPKRPATGGAAEDSSPAGGASANHSNLNLNLNLNFYKEKDLRKIIDMPVSQIQKGAAKGEGKFMKWLRPDKYTNFTEMRRLVPKDFADIRYSDEEAKNAYFHPSITAEPPTLWLPKDEGGISAQEASETSRFIKCIDGCGAKLNEKNKVVWDPESAAQAPIYESKVYY